MPLSKLRKLAEMKNSGPVLVFPEVRSSNLAPYSDWQPKLTNPFFSETRALRPMESSLSARIQCWTSFHLQSKSTSSLSSTPTSIRPQATREDPFSLISSSSLARFVLANFPLSPSPSPCSLRTSSDPIHVSSLCTVPAF